MRLLWRVLGRASLLGLGAALALASDIPIEGPEFDPATGMRILRYRAPLPDLVAGGTRILAPDLKKILVEEDAVLIDVMAAEGAGYDPSSGEWRLNKQHETIPGAVWLPDVGKGRIDDRLEAFYRHSLERLTGGDKSRAIVLFCQSDCWMSWNAVKRAAALGYTRIYWMPDGVDGWRDWEGTTTRAIPQRVD